MRLNIKVGNKPVKIDEDNWLYHDRKNGIQLIHRVRTKRSGAYIQTDSIRIRKSIFERLFK